jgi:hypothetical protein
MHPFNILVSLLFAFATTSYASPEPAFHTIEVRKERNSTDSRGDKSCAQIRKFTFLTSLASNQTKLDTLVSSGKMSTKKADEIKAKAVDANTKLKTLTSNSTLTAECATINADRKVKQECKQMKRWEKLAKLASNTTALNAFAASTKMNGTAVDALKARLQKVETKLKEAQANTTLTDFCKQMKQANGKPANADGESKFIC